MQSMVERSESVEEEKDYHSRDATLSFVRAAKVEGGWELLDTTDKDVLENYLFGKNATLKSLADHLGLKHPRHAGQRYFEAMADLWNVASAELQSQFDIKEVLMLRRQGMGKGFRLSDEMKRKIGASVSARAERRKQALMNMHKRSR